MSERADNPQSLQYCIDRIRESGQPGSEVVIGAMALWIAAHGDFDLPQPAVKYPVQEDIETIDTTFETTLMPTISTELARVSFGDVAHREKPILTGEAIDNTVDFKNAITDVFAPYITGVNAKVQHADKLKIKKTGTYTWRDQQVINNQLTNVFFKAPYRSHGKHNEATGLEIAYSRRSKPHKRDLHIILNFQNGGVHTLGIKDFENNVGAFKGYYNAPNILPYLLATNKSNHAHIPSDTHIEWSTAVLGKNRHEAGFCQWFRFQDDIPAIISNGDGGRTCRTFDPEINGFRSTRQSSFKELPETSDNIMPADTVVSFLAGLLATLPRQEDTLSQRAELWNQSH